MRFAVIELLYIADRFSLEDLKTRAEIELISLLSDVVSIAQCLDTAITYSARNVIDHCLRQLQSGFLSEEELEVIDELSQEAKALIEEARRSAKRPSLAASRLSNMITGGVTVEQLRSFAASTSSAGASLDESKALHLAVSNLDIEMVTEIISLGASINLE
ncbi:hypothetical protein CYMTET_35514, partial [Cymbomonas tetramitiformis]